jgi:Fe-S-cluster-containing dehydrogenase component/DMSO reductase anchor subunit
MASGFIFNTNRCVNCGSCAAACVLENGWQVRPRNIISSNSEASLRIPLFNLSMACNHCEVPACLEGCPASAYYREKGTGAIVIDDTRCIGCRYCQWNCPYDAPKFDSQSKVMEKCNMCYSLLEKGLDPACATACPTGALSYGVLPDKPEEFPAWFPDKKLIPSVYFSQLPSAEPLRIEPLSIFRNELPSGNNNESSIGQDWSLIAFTFLVTISTAIMVSSLLKGEFFAAFLPVLLIIISGIVSLLHLGRPSRAWRALLNIRKSPLSREIALFLVFSLLSLSAFLLQSPALLIAAAVAGTLMLFFIDSVYIFSDRKINMYLNSGQTLLSMLIISSFIGGLTIPFIFAAAVKLFLSSYCLFLDKGYGLRFKLRFFRVAILVLVMTFTLSGSFTDDPAIIAVFLAGELADRILFYLDFNPDNIRTSILKEQNREI